MLKELFILNAKLLKAEALDQKSRIRLLNAIIKDRADKLVKEKNRETRHDHNNKNRQ